MRRRPVRLLISAFIMAQMIRLFFTGWTKEGVWIFGVDVLILLLIFGEDLLKFIVWIKHWREHKRFETQVRRWLDSLTPVEADFMKKLVLLRHEPLSEVTLKFKTQMPRLFDSDYRGTYVVPEYKRFLQNWAEGK